MYSVCMCCSAPQKTCGWNASARPMQRARQPRPCSCSSCSFGCAVSVSSHCGPPVEGSLLSPRRPGGNPADAHHSTPTVASTSRPARRMKGPVWPRQGRGAVLSAAVAGQLIRLLRCHFCPPACSPPAPSLSYLCASSQPRRMCPLGEREHLLRIIVGLLSLLRGPTRAPFYSTPSRARVIFRTALESVRSNKTCKNKAGDLRRRRDWPMVRGRRGAGGHNNTEYSVRSARSL